MVPWDCPSHIMTPFHGTTGREMRFNCIVRIRRGKMGTYIQAIIISVPGKWILSLYENMCWESPHDATSACALSIVTLLCQILLRYPTSCRCLSWAQFSNNMVYLIKTVNCYLFFIYCFSHGTWNINLTLVSYVDFAFICSLST